MIWVPLVVLTVIWLPVGLWLLWQFARMVMEAADAAERRRAYREYYGDKAKALDTLLSLTITRRGKKRPIHYKDTLGPWIDDPTDATTDPKK